MVTYENWLNIMTKKKVTLYYYVKGYLKKNQ